VLAPRLLLGRPSGEVEIKLVSGFGHGARRCKPTVRGRKREETAQSGSVCPQGGITERTPTRGDLYRFWRRLPPPRRFPGSDRIVPSRPQATFAKRPPGPPSSLFQAGRSGLHRNAAMRS
jgi:hypothetical protein